MRANSGVRLVECHVSLIQSHDLPVSQRMTFFDQSRVFSLWRTTNMLQAETTNKWSFVWGSLDMKTVPLHSSGCCMSISFKVINYEKPQCIASKELIGGKWLIK